MSAGGGGSLATAGLEAGFHQLKLVKLDLINFLLFFIYFDFNLLFLFF
jgi:hypothetical protein